MATASACHQGDLRPGHRLNDDRWPRALQIEQKQGATRLHLVDFEAAREGVPAN